MNLSDFALLKEDQDSYVIGHPKGKSMTVPKRGLSGKAQELVSKLKREQHFDDGGMQADPSAGSVPAVKIYDPNEWQKDAEIQEVAKLSTPAPQDQLPPELQSSSASPELNGAQAATAEQSPPAAAPSGMMAPDLQAPITAAEGAIKGGVAAEGKIGEATSDAMDDYFNSVKDLPSPEERQMASHAADERFRQHLEDTGIDPNRFYKNLGTGSKIAAGIGMILGGIGSGLTGQPNMAVQMMNNAIERDIDAQKNDQSKTMNLWKMNREATQSDIEADLMTRNQHLTQLQVQLKQAAAQQASPLAAARAAPEILQLEQEKARNRWMLSMAQGGSPGSEQQHIGNMNMMQQMRPDLYKDMQSKYIPSLGTARVPVNENERTELTSLDNLTKTLSDAKNFAQTQAGSIGTLPGSAANAVADRMREAIAVNLGKLDGLNRMTETEGKIFHSGVTSPGSFFKSKAVAQLDELQKEVNRHQASLMGHLGIVPFQKAPQDQQAVAWAKANPGNPKAAQILQLNMGAR